ncbi:hypothetical protein I547_0474 [Mycobacterium kansasii 824]|uniref:Uncharacterized protein n=1 Tax=Mycobacterium kansasii TaxID=1768 RepID=A0A1V3XRF3_MYCKA|nr:hypothetical protein I547_0474 [Mycobacterium kansasii 824]OOK81814.1 hypothetical protein BZL30_0909 [Mycobacterium kansasii]OOK84146.1 hypothetical protein BZL29_0986 [Mycobacterium kansasii]
MELLYGMGRFLGPRPYPDDRAGRLDELGQQWRDTSQHLRTYLSCASWPAARTSPTCRL